MQRGAEATSGAALANGALAPAPRDAPRDSNGTQGHSKKRFFIVFFLSGRDSTTCVRESMDNSTRLSDYKWRTVPLPRDTGAGKTSILADFSDFLRRRDLLERIFQ